MWTRIYGPHVYSTPALEVSGLIHAPAAFTHKEKQPIQVEWAQEPAWTLSLLQVVEPRFLGCPVRRIANVLPELRRLTRCVTEMLGLQMSVAVSISLLLTIVFNTCVLIRDTASFPYQRLCCHNCFLPD